MIQSKAYIISIKGSILFLSLLFFYSCSSYIKYLEQQDSEEFILKSQLKDKELYCSPKAKNSTQRETYNIVHSSESGRDEFSKIINSMTRHNRYSISELGLFYILYNSIVRPDSTGWNSRLQLFVNEGGQRYYYDLHKDQNNFIHAINVLKDNKLSKLSQNQLLKKAKSHFPKKMTVQKQFSEYLEKQRDHLSKSQKRKYFRLNKPLQKGETFPINQSLFTPIQVRYQKIEKAPLFNIKETSKAVCNFDSKLYESGIFIIHDDNLHENIFAITAKNGDFIIVASSSGTLKKAHSLIARSVVEVPKFNTPLCHYEDEQKSFTSVAFDSRDSGQLLYHLFQYGYFKSKNLEELIEYTSYARHLFLTNPPRMLYESKRGTPKELNYFLSLNFPVYHAKEIGQIHTMASFDLKEKSRSTIFVQDERTSYFQSCHQ